MVSLVLDTFRFDPVSKAEHHEMYHLRWNMLRLRRYSLSFSLPEIIILMTKGDQ